MANFQGGLGGIHHRRPLDGRLLIGFVRPALPGAALSRHPQRPVGFPRLSCARVDAWPLVPAGEIECAVDRPGGRAVGSASSLGLSA